jgi:hypothetical protein
MGVVPRNGCVRAGLIGLAVLIAVLAALAGVLFLVVGSIDFDFRLDLGPRDLGVERAADDSLLVTSRGCDQASVQSVILRGPDGAELWRAEAPSPQPVVTVTVGAAPPGFSDVVPLTAPLDPAADYTVELRALPAPAALAASTGPSDPTMTFGGTARFRPADVVAGRVWFAGRSLPTAEFDARSCERPAPA